MHVQEEVEAEKKKLTEYFRTGEGSKYCPTSLYFQRKLHISSYVVPRRAISFW